MSVATTARSSSPPLFLVELINVFFFFCFPSDTCISSLLEAALSGNEEQKPFECTLRPDLSVLVDLALGSSKEPANSLWINMQDYAISKGLHIPHSLSLPASSIAAQV